MRCSVCNWRFPPQRAGIKRLPRSRRRTPMPTSLDPTLPLIAANSLGVSMSMPRSIDVPTTMTVALPFGSTRRISRRTPATSPKSRARETPPDLAMMEEDRTTCKNRGSRGGNLAGKGCQPWVAYLPSAPSNPRSALNSQRNAASSLLRPRRSTATASCSDHDDSGFPVYVPDRIFRGQIID